MGKKHKQSAVTETVETQVQSDAADMAEAQVETQVEKVEVSAPTAHAPVALRVRTRDGRRQHLRALLVFGADWRTLDRSSLSDEQIAAIMRDPLLEVETVE